MRKAVLSVFLLGLTTAAPAQHPYDTVIAGGRIIDGTGNPWYVGDVAIRAGRVVAIGPLCSAAKTCAALAPRVLDAKGLYVAPGFIDVHSHSEGGIQSRGTAENYLFDGVTSLVSGNCGGSETNLAATFARLRELGISINYSTLIGHNSVRAAVMGRAQRDPTPEEQSKMEALVEQAMREGAVGFSTGLLYIPGTYSKTPEVVGMARAAAKHNGVYATHMRNEEDAVVEAINEALHIGRESGIPVQISHFKIANQKMFGFSRETIAMVERARADGLDVTVDQYPYTAASTNLGIVLPSWVQAGGREEMLKRFADAATRARIIREAAQMIRSKYGRKRLDYAVVANAAWDRSLEGKSISQINKERGRKGKLEAEISTAMEILEKGMPAMVYHLMDERDVERILQYPWTMVAADGGIIEFGRGTPHPRSYGTNARVLARYVREKGTLRIEEAIRKMTSLPAQRFRLNDRGVLRPGMWADVVVFDAGKVRDAATFEKPHAYSDGFAFVLVNGTVVIADGKHTGARPGQVLLGPGAQ
jgi:N-acyl-D-amino-acid deacylase